MQRLEDELNQRESEVKDKTEAIRLIVYEAHHRGLNPVFKTCRGIINVARMEFPDSETMKYWGMVEEQILKAETEEMNRISKIEPLQ